MSERLSRERVVRWRRRPNCKPAEAGFRHDALCDEVLALMDENEGLRERLVMRPSMAGVTEAREASEAEVVRLQDDLARAAIHAGHLLAEAARLRALLGWAIERIEKRAPIDLWDHTGFPDMGTFKEARRAALGEQS